MSILPDSIIFYPGPDWKFNSSERKKMNYGEYVPNFFSTKKPLSKVTFASHTGNKINYVA